MDEIMQDTLLDDIRNYFAMWPDGICQSCKDSKEQHGEVHNFCRTCDARFLLRQAQQELDTTCTCDCHTDSDRYSFRGCCDDAHRGATMTTDPRLSIEALRLSDEEAHRAMRSVDPGHPGYNSIDLKNRPRVVPIDAMLQAVSNAATAKALSGFAAFVGKMVDDPKWDKNGKDALLTVIGYLVFASPGEAAILERPETQGE